MDLSFQEVLSGARASKVIATLPWMVSYFREGPPPVVAEVMTSSRRGAFYEELVKLSDLRQKLDARSILVVPRRRIGADEVRLASSFGVYVVLEGDLEGLLLASRGADVGEANSRAMSAILGRKNRKAASECRDAILAVLKERWLTLGELASELQLSFGERTVSQQLRSLARAGTVKVLGRTRGGEGVYGLPGSRYPLRGDLSRSSMLRHLKEAITEVLASSPQPLGSAEVSDRIGASRHQARFLLRSLSDEGRIKKAGGGWILEKV